MCGGVSIRVPEPLKPDSPVVCAKCGHLFGAWEAFARIAEDASMFGNRAAAPGNLNSEPTRSATRQMLCDQLPTRGSSMVVAADVKSA